MTTNTSSLNCADGDLGMFEIDFLCEEDRQYLRSAEGTECSKKHLDQEQAWELIDGFKLVGTLVDYAQTKVTIQRRRGKTYINDRAFDALPPVYQTVVLKTLGQFEKIADIDRDKFNRWVLKLGGQPRTFDVDGIVMELRDGNEYTIPFVLFSSRSLQLLRGGWKHGWPHTNRKTTTRSTTSHSACRLKRQPSSATNRSRNRLPWLNTILTWFVLESLRCGK